MAFTEPPGGVMGKTLPSSMTQASKRKGPSAANISSIAEAKSARSITASTECRTPRQSSYNRD